MGALFWYHCSSFMIASGIVMVLMPLVVFFVGTECHFLERVMRICYGIGRKIDIRRCEREQFTKLHTGIKQKLQSSVCSWIIYQGNEVVVLIEHLEEEKTIVTTFRNYAEVKKA